MLADCRGHCTPIPCRRERDLPLSVTGRLGVLAGDGGSIPFRGGGGAESLQPGMQPLGAQMLGDGEAGSPGEGEIGGRTPRVQRQVNQGPEYSIGVNGPQAGAPRVIA